MYPNEVSEVFIIGSSAKDIVVPKTCNIVFVEYFLPTRVEPERLQTTMSCILPINITYHNNIKRIHWNTWYPTTSFPSSLTHLKFGDMYSHPIYNLPENITFIQFGMCFNSILINLPPKLKQIYFGYWFNKPVENLPDTLTHLRFGSKFMQRVNKFPPNLTHLWFENGNSFDLSNDILPDTITNLCIGLNYTKYIHKIPSGLLYISGNIRHKQFDHIRRICNINKYNLAKKRSGLFDDLLK